MTPSAVLRTNVVTDGDASPTTGRRNRIATQTVHQAVSTSSVVTLNDVAIEIIRTLGHYLGAHPTSRHDLTDAERDVLTLVDRSRPIAGPQTIPGPPEPEDHSAPSGDRRINPRRYFRRPQSSPQETWGRELIERADRLIALCDAYFTQGGVLLMPYRKVGTYTWRKPTRVTIPSKQHASRHSPMATPRTASSADRPTGNYFIENMQPGMTWKPGEPLDLRQQWEQRLHCESNEFYRQMQLDALGITIDRKTKEPRYRSEDQRPANDIGLWLEYEMNIPTDLDVPLSRPTADMAYPASPRSYRLDLCTQSGARAFVLAIGCEFLKHHHREQHGHSTEPPLLFSLNKTLANALNMSMHLRPLANAATESINRDDRNRSRAIAEREQDVFLGDLFDPQIERAAAQCDVSGQRIGPRESHVQRAGEPDPVVREFLGQLPLVPNRRIHELSMVVTGEPPDALWDTTSIAYDVAPHEPPVLLQDFRYPQVRACRPPTPDERKANPNVTEYPRITIPETLPLASTMELCLTPGTR